MVGNLLQYRIFCSRNTHKERLLAIFPLHCRHLHQIIPNSQPQPLRSRRTIQNQRLQNPIIPSRTQKRIPQRKQNSSTQKQRRLTSALAALYRPQMFPRDALQKAHVEFLRDVTDAGDLVISGPTRGELAILGPEGFFDREQSLALYKGAFDLTVVNCGVYGTANVHLDVCSKDRVVPCEEI